jgi:hypothetical protein
MVEGGNVLLYMSVSILERQVVLCVLLRLMLLRPCIVPPVLGISWCSC